MSFFSKLQPLLLIPLLCLIILNIASLSLLGKTVDALNAQKHQVTAMKQNLTSHFNVTCPKKLPPAPKETFFSSFVLDSVLSMPTGLPDPAATPVSLPPLSAPSLSQPSLAAPTLSPPVPLSSIPTPVKRQLASSVSLPSPTALPSPTIATNLPAPSINLPPLEIAFCSLKVHAGNYVAPTAVLVAGQAVSILAALWMILNIFRTAKKDTLPSRSILMPALFAVLVPYVLGSLIANTVATYSKKARVSSDQLLADALVQEAIKLFHIQTKYRQFNHLEQFSVVSWFGWLCLVLSALAVLRQYLLARKTVHPGVPNADMKERLPSDA